MTILILFQSGNQKYTTTLQNAKQVQRAFFS